MSPEDTSPQLIEFLDSGKFKLALVSARAKGKLQVRDRNGKQHRVADRQVLVEHPVRLEADRFEAFADELEGKIQELGEEIDTELLWDSVSSEIREYDLEELTSSYFDSTSPVELSAMLRTLFADPVHFRVRGRRVTPRTPEQVEDQVRTLKKREERRQQRARALEWLEELLASQEPVAGVPEELTGLVEALEAFLWHQQDHPSLQWLRELESVSQSSDLRQTVIEVLTRSGRISSDASPRLLRAGIREDFSAAHLQAAGALVPFETEGSAREDFTALESFSIDDAETRDIDDAISLESIDGGGHLLGIHIADVAHFIEQGSPLDREAHRRGASIYLPERRVPMFPPRLGWDLASLVAGEVRPTVSLVIDLDADLEPVGWRFTRGVVRVKHRLDYEQADALIESSPESELARTLGVVRRLTDRLEARRRERGALTIQRPELKLELLPDDVQASVIRPDSPSRALVSELMVLMNSHAARLCQENEIPCLYRAQDPPEGEVEVPETYDPVRLDRVFRALKRGRVTLHSGAHAGLGLETYTQVTSPIRRYQDLAVQRQIVAHLASEPLPYSKSDLLEILTTVQIVEGEIRTLEREAVQDYTLRFVKGHLRDQPLLALVVTALDDGHLVELIDWPIRGKLIGPEAREPGDHLDVQVRDVNPADGVLVFEAAPV